MTRAEDIHSLALDLRALGWSIVPVHVPVKGMCSCGNDECSWPGKHPRVAWREFTRRIPTWEEINEWFSDEFYGSNIGVVTGRVSKLTVVDVDAPFDVFKKLKLPRTLAALTGGGGYHFFYTTTRLAPSGISVVEGIDIKSEGGFVVLPPSEHASGNYYKWMNTLGPKLLDVNRLPKRTVEYSSNGSEWVNELLQGVPESMRSNSAARLAGRYANLGLTIDETLMLMISWNSLNNPPLPLRELGKTIESVYQKHQRNQEYDIETLDDMYQLFGDLTGRGGG